jgi:hypothetical protein
MSNSEMTDTDRIICAVFILLVLTHGWWLPLLFGV